MNWADYVIIGILALSTLMGFWRGLVAEVLSVAIWVAAFWVAWMFGPRVASGLRNLIETPSIRIIVAWALCFVAVLVLGALLRFAIERLVRGTGLAGSDRLLGMLFGLARGVLLVTLLVFLVGFTTFTGDRWWHQSRLLPTFIQTADWLGQHVPDQVRQYLHTHAPALGPSEPPGTPPATGVSARRPAPVASRGGTVAGLPDAAGAASVFLQRLAPNADSRDN